MIARRNYGPTTRQRASRIVTYRCNALRHLDVSDNLLLSAVPDLHTSAAVDGDHRAIHDVAVQRFVVGGHLVNLLWPGPDFPAGHASNMGGMVGTRESRPVSNGTR